MRYLLYFVLSILATAIGAATGMGGGVILKPALDMLGHYDVASISVLSSATVFVMSAVSLWRQRKSPYRPQKNITIPLAAGAALGGNAGNLLLRRLLADGGRSSQTTVVQNIVLAMLIVAVFVYMLHKQKLPSLNRAGIASSALTGLFLGITSSFLGIGGGPINVALIIFVFGFSTKTAALCSLLTILFSQGANLLLTLLAGGFGGYALSMLPVMLAGAVAGGLIGAYTHRHTSAKATDILFNAAQVLAFCLCLLNILRSLGNAI
ncbi:MAG: sulfite exporter TauE/SafE family protein [Clostridiales bacterium]|nr:sulfite exporter TauE/SafE family protein [Clostridiales bacterium]